MKKFIFFFLILSTFYILIHIYIADFLSKSGIDRNRVRFVLLLFALFSILSFFLRRFFYNDFISWFYFFCFLWIGIAFLAFFFFLTSDIIIKIFKLSYIKVFGINIFLFLLILLYCVLKSFSFPNVKELIFYSDKIDKNYSFYFISDLHLDFKFKNRIFKNIFSYINKSDGEFVIIGGDFFDPGFQYQDFMKDISSKPVYFVNGNHEYYYGIDKVLLYIEKLGFVYLENKSITFGKLNLIGIDDIKTTQLSLRDVDKILNENYKNDYLNVIISHQPLYFKEISSRYDVIYLAGHTHCGQIFPFHIFTKIFYPYFCGNYKSNSSFLYVSSGAGLWGPQMRLLSKSEIVKITIKKK
ncbi:MAG: metallophosphoesterase [Elusimicrobiales bacterium]|nr:metallophosphoesterase [Elusimicrobiales bacterium]